MLVELGLVEQRYQAVREVLDHGASVTDVARRNGVSRQAVHEWLVKYANHALAGLVDRSSTPQSCPHQMTPMVEARIVELRREHPGWGPRPLERRLTVHRATRTIDCRSDTVSTWQTRIQVKHPPRQGCRPRTSPRLMASFVPRTALLRR